MSYWFMLAINNTNQWKALHVCGGIHVLGCITRSIGCENIMIIMCFRMGRATQDECMAPTSLHTDDEINVFNQCAHLGSKYILSTNLLRYECLSHKYKFGVHGWYDLTWFSGPDPQLCAQVAEQSVLVTRHIMQRVQRWESRELSPSLGGEKK